MLSSADTVHCLWTLKPRGRWTKAVDPPQSSTEYLVKPQYYCMCGHVLLYLLKTRGPHSSIHVRKGLFSAQLFRPDPGALRHLVASGERFLDATLMWIAVKSRKV